MPGVGVTGGLSLEGRDVYAPGTDVADLRRRAGMVFAVPIPLPRSFRHPNAQSWAQSSEQILYKKYVNCLDNYLLSVLTLLLPRSFPELSITPEAATFRKKMSP